MTLEKVLFTVLSTTQKELENLEKVRRKNNTGLLSYFYTPAQISVAKPLRIKNKQLNDLHDLGIEFE